MSAAQLGLTLRRTGADGVRRYVRSERPLAREHEMQAQWCDALTKLIAPPGTLSPAGVVWWSVDIADARNAVVAALRKRRGVISAIPDMVFHWPPGRVGYVEAKTVAGAVSRTRKVLRRKGKNVRLVEVLGQDELHSAIRISGTPVVVCRDLDDLLSVLSVWGVPMRTSALRAELA